MPTAYHVYSNGGSGPVNYSAPLASGPGLSYLTDPLAPSSTYRFAVRAYDTVTGLEELNVDAVVEIVTNAAGIDVAGVPLPPEGLTAGPTAGGGILVSWSCPDAGGASRTGRAPLGFRVYRGTGPAPDYTAPVGTVPFVPFSPQYRYQDSGLTDGVTYSYGVRAYNAAGAESNVLSVAAVADASAPGGVDFLTATAL